MCKEIPFGETAALHEGEGAGGAQSSRRVGLSAPDRFHLDVPHPAKKNSFILMFKGGKGAAERILGPALRIRLHRILKEAVERYQQICG